MSRSVIYTVDAAGELTAMRPSEPRSEDFMQALVARHPEIIADADGRLLLIRREQPIQDSNDSGGRWSLDHLFVTRSGVPVLVELKRAVDARLRREVVGQMLDYAANGTAYWQAGRIAESFMATMAEAGRDPESELATFLEGVTEPEQFWQQVDANFAAGRIKMVFVADTIPRELARIVEFLNEQMQADVRAVELSWFESEAGVTALTPRIIGETERAQTSKAARTNLVPISREEWIEKHLEPFGTEPVSAAHRFIEMIAAAGGHAEVSSAQGSIIAVFETANGPLYPMALNYSAKGSVALNLQYIAHRPAFSSEEARKDIYDGLVGIVGALSTQSLKGFPKFAATRLNEPGVSEKISTLLKGMADQANA